MESIEYNYIQEACNLRKLWAIHVSPLLIPYISYIVKQYLFALDPSRDSDSVRGLTHGSRNGFEGYALAKLLNCAVTGTDISETANFFPSMRKHDFHFPLKDSENNIQEFDFIYTNSYDHAHSPIQCLHAMYENLKETGIIIIDMHESSSSKESTTTDPHVFTIDSVKDYIENFNSESHGQLFLTAVHSTDTVSSKPLLGRSRGESSKLIGMGIEVESVDQISLKFKEETIFLVITKKSPKKIKSLNKFVDFTIHDSSFIDNNLNEDHTAAKLADDLLQCCFSSISIAKNVQTLFMEQVPFNWSQGFKSDEDFYKKYAEHCINLGGSIIKDLKLFL